MSSWPGKRRQAGAYLRAGLGHGEPEPEHWQTPGWLAHLRLCAGASRPAGRDGAMSTASAPMRSKGNVALACSTACGFEACDAHGIGLSHGASD